MNHPIFVLTKDNDINCIIASQNKLVILQQLADTHAKHSNRAVIRIVEYSPVMCGWERPPLIVDI